MNKLLTFFTTFINKMIAHENELEEICKSNLKEKNIYIWNMNKLLTFFMTFILEQGVSSVQ